MPMAERYSLAEVQLLTGHATTSYLHALKLHQLVFTEEQVVRESSTELFLQTPAAPPPTSAAIDPDAMPPPAPAEPPAEAEADTYAEAAAPTPAAAPAEEAAATPTEEAQPLADADLTAAITATINSQVAAHSAQLAAEYADQEQKLLNRIGELELKLN